MVLFFYWFLIYIPGILTSKSIFSSFLCPNFDQKWQFFLTLGHFGKHFERRPLLEICRILKIFDGLLIFTVFTCVNVILTSKSVFTYSLVSKLWPKLTIFFIILGHFGSHFERRPLLKISKFFENILRTIDFYCFYICN